MHIYFSSAALRMMKAGVASCGALVTAKGNAPFDLQQFNIFSSVRTAQNLDSDCV